MISAALALLVVVEVSPPQLTSEEQLALVEACSSALGGLCTLGNGAPGEPDAVAVLTTAPDRQRIQIALERRGDGLGEWRRRTLEFETADPLPDRWRAIGLTIATLFGESGTEATQTKAAEHADKKKRPPVALPPTVPPHSAPASKTTQPTAPRSPRPPQRLMVQLGGLAGPGLEHSPWRFGGAARITYHPPSFPIAPTLSFAALGSTKNQEGVQISSELGSLGLTVGRTLSLLDLRSRLRMEGFLELLGAGHSPPEDHRTRWILGARAGAELVWPASSWIGLVIGADLWLRGSSTQIWVGVIPIARVSPITATGTIATEFRFR